MIVVKLGGSLLATGVMRDCLNALGQRYQGEAVVIVPGGGAFADQVREAQSSWRFNDNTAHQMAILAMQQMALLIQSLGKNFILAGSLATIRAQALNHSVLVWSPAIEELDYYGIPATWDITSDSLSAWLAGKLAARRLVLVKSVKIAQSLNSHALIEKNIVDAAFFKYAKLVSAPIEFIDQESFRAGESALSILATN
jgi:aspartokinase-like uncharacterized kinase